MMPPLAVDAALARRLEALTGTDAACCVEDLQEAVKEIQETPTFERALDWARALGEPNRLAAAALLKRRGSLCACEVQAGLGLTHATVSHHMATLLDANVVTAEKRGKWTYYTLVKEVASLVP